MKPLSTRIKRFQPKTGTAPAVSPVPDGTGIFKAWERTGKYTFRLSTSIPLKIPSADGLKKLGKVFGFSHAAEGMVFYDTETTGLSAGAGSIAFLAGFGRYEKGSFTIDQYFLSDFPGEREFLGLIAGRLDASRLFVSYNGRAFDRHLLASRFLMNAMRIVQPEQFDLLFPSRSLWRSVIGSCSLSNVESAVLGVRRTLDIPGEEIPDVYFRFLRSGGDPRMAAVVEHHRQDIVSLALLLSRLAEILSDPDSAPGVDRARLSRLLKRVDPERAGEFARRCFGAGDRGCGVELGREYKKSRDWLKAVAVWETLAASGDDLDAAVELAKFHEHRSKDYQKALDYVDRCLAMPAGRAGGIRERLLHRKTRLKKKAG